MRGISAIVELLLITLLLITLVSLLWLFTSGTVNAIAKSGTNQTQRTQEIFSTCMIVDSVYGYTVYLKNCGYGVITNDSLGVYLDDAPLTYTMTPQKIGKGEVGTININSADLVGINTGDHDLKITNPSAQTVQRVTAEGADVPPDSTILALDFDEGSGLIAYDKSAYNNYGNLINNPIWTDGNHNKALSFTEGGSGGGGASCGTFTCVFTTSSAPFSLTQITVSAWIKQQPYSRCELIVARKTSSFRFGVGGTCSGVCDASNLNSIIFQIWNTGGGQNNFWSTKNVSLGIWHYILANYNGSFVSFYLDGENVGSTSYNGGIYGSSDSNYIIGAGDGGCQGGFNGIIDSIRVYNKSLTSDQIGISLKMK